jgi:glycosyltransferase involved in cell wall biosynthesis
VLDTSMTAKKILVVLPALNEAPNVGRVITEVRQSLPSAQVLVVDDGSSDATAERARDCGVDVARLAVNLGVGGAMRTGFRYARARGYDIVVQVDADGQHDPAEITLLTEALERADVVIGARFAGRGDYLVRGPRRWAMKVLAVVLSWLAGTRLSDVTSGFRACGPRAIQLFAAHYPAEYLGDTVESLVMATRAGLTVRQVPVEMRARNGGQPSQTPVRAAIYLMRAGLALTLALVRRRPSVGTDSA